jgi:methyl-accepting chemotaxis protein
MTQQDDIDDVPSMVPDREDLVSHRKQKRGTGVSQRVPVTTTSTVGVQEVYVTRTSGGVIFFITFLFLGLCASGAGGFYFYQQSETTKGELLGAMNRITALEGTLNDMDVAVKESAGGLMEKVDFNFSEIDKLWAARNALRTEVEKLTAGMAAVTKASTDLEAAVSNHGGQLNQHNTQVAAIQTRIEDINKNFSGMSNLGQQLTQLNADLNRVKTAMTQVQDDVEGRLSATEQDIESINVYRLQLNQTLTALQNSVNTLQQRVGQ